MRFPKHELSLNSIVFPLQLDKPEVLAVTWPDGITVVGLNVNATLPVHGNVVVVGGNVVLVVGMPGGTVTVVVVVLVVVVVVVVTNVIKPSDIRAIFLLIVPTVIV